MCPCILRQTSTKTKIHQFNQTETSHENPLFPLESTPDPKILSLNVPFPTLNLVLLISLV